jgi:predicted ArsR family transcriptional regulator
MKQAAPPLPSRDRIIELLLWEPRTVDELASEIGLTLNGVRAQLSGLERDGLVARIGVRHVGEVGKPPSIYALTQRAEAELSAAYQPALLALVESLRESVGCDQLLAHLSAAGQRLGAEVQATTAVGILERLGARARSTSLPDGGERVEGASCPLAVAVAGEPATCELVRSMLATGLDREVTIRCNYETRPTCCFELHEKDCHKRETTTRERVPEERLPHGRG